MYAQGYLATPVANAAIKSYIGRMAPEILENCELVVNTVSMEESLEQKEAEEAANAAAGPDASASIAAYVAETMEGRDADETDAENENVAAQVEQSDVTAVMAGVSRDVTPADLTTTEATAPVEPAE